MHWTLALIACLVLWALAGGIWRASGLALAAAWAAGQVWWLVTGDQTPIAFYLATDAAVCGVIFWRAGSRLDWFILALFPAAWWSYAYQEGAAQWWTLWLITAAQLALAGPWPQLQRGLHFNTHGPRKREVKI